MTEAAPTPMQRSVAIQKVLRVWAAALDCPTSQVADVVRKAGLPIEKLWNSIDATANGHLVYASNPRVEEIGRVHVVS